MIMRAHVPVRLSRLALCTAGLVAALALPAWAQRQAPAATPQASQPAPRPGPAATSAERPVTPPIPAESGAVVQQTRGVRASAAQPVPITPVATTARGDGRTFQAAIPVDVQYVSSDEADLPSDARELVRKFSQTTAQTRREAEEAIARERSGVIEQLQKMQDAETKAGHLDQALAIRARIRVLQSGGRVQYSAAYSTVTTPDWSGSWEGFVAAPPPPPPPAPVRPAVPPTPAAAPPPPPAPRP